MLAFHATLVAVSVLLSPVTGTVNLLANPSFEQGHYVCVRPHEGDVYHCSELPERGVLVQEIDVPNHWTFHYWLGSISPYTGEHVAAQPEARLVDRRYPARVKDGGYSYKVYATWHTYAFALSQAVRLESGGLLTPCIAFHFWLNEEGKAGLHPNGNPRSEFEEGAQVCVSAVTSQGITQECGIAVDEFQDLCAPPLLVSATPDSPTEVVFRVAAGVSKPYRNNDVYLDDARLLFTPVASGYAIWTSGQDTAHNPQATAFITLPVTPTASVTTPVPFPASTPSPTPTPPPPSTPTPSRFIVGITPLPPTEVEWRGYLAGAHESGASILPTATPAASPQTEERPAIARRPSVFQIVVGVVLVGALALSRFKDKVLAALRR